MLALLWILRFLVPGGEIDPACAEFAKRIEKADHRGDAEFLRKHFDAEALLRGAVAHSGIPKEEIEAFRKGIDLDVAKDVVAPRERGTEGEFKLLEIRADGGEHRLIFRLVKDDGNLDYYTFHVRRIGDGEPRIVDIRIGSTDESIAESVRNSFLHYCAGRELRPGKLGQEEADFLDRCADINELYSLPDRKEVGPFLDRLQKLPISVQKKTFLLLPRLLKIEAVSSEQLEKLSEVYQKAGVSKLALGLQALAFYRHLGNAEKSLGALAQIASEIKNEPYLVYLRGSFFADAEKFEEATSDFKMAISMEPGFQDYHWGLLSVAVERKRFGEATELLGGIEKQFGEQALLGMEEDPFYNELFSSREFDRWLAGRKK